MSDPINNRYEFVLLYDVENGNPNGDPDAGNMPRIDPETGYGIVTDVCLKRKIRNYVELVQGDKAGYRIYVKEGTPLNQNHADAYVAIGLKTNEKANLSQVNEARQWMCANFFDVRTFGAVMSTGDNCGQVRGPIQINFSRSIDPILQQEVTITRQAVTRIEDIDKERTMGRKHIIPYALYRVEGYISAKLANDETKGTGFSEEDLALFWEAVINMFEHDRSAARGKMAVRKLIVFKHDSELGNAPAHQLFDLVSVENRDPAKPSRSYSDYEVQVAKELVPSGVTIIEKTMTPNYSPDDTLALSGIQHFNFCRRQWALIHVERQWKDNALTANGRIMHKRADDPFFSEVRNGVVIARSMPVVSYRLGLYGVCDIVEFTPDEDGVLLAGRPGRFRPMPVEYKRGKEKKDGSDEAQLCAQVICLEEMLSTGIERASFYYGETRRRLEIEIGQGTA